MSWWSDVVAALEAVSGNPSAVGPGSPAASDTSNAITSASSLGGLVTVVEGIWAGATDGKLWRSLGWIILGVLLMLMGAWLFATKFGVPGPGSGGGAEGLTRAVK